MNLNGGSTFLTGVRGKGKVSQNQTATRFSLSDPWAAEGGENSLEGIFDLILRIWTECRERRAHLVEVYPQERWRYVTTSNSLTSSVVWQPEICKLPQGSENDACHSSGIQTLGESYIGSSLGAQCDNVYYYRCLSCPYIRIHFMHFLK